MDEFTSMNVSSHSKTSLSDLPDENSAWADFSYNCPEEFNLTIA